VSSIPALTATTVITQWYAAPIALAVSVAAVAAYAHGLHRLRARGRQWPRHRTVLFGVGMLVYLYVSCGAPQVYGRTLFSMWTGQMLMLLLVVPGLVMGGQVVELNRMVAGPGSIGTRLLRSRPGRVLSSPLVGPVIIPVLSAGLFFGPVPGWAVASPVAGWLLQLLLVVIGSAIVLPLVATDDDRASLAVALAMGIGFIELLLDAIPGIVLRLQTHISSTYFEHHLVQSWSPSNLRDQQFAGGVLWCAAELLDLPFLILVFQRLIHADARDAREIDTVLDAERIARGIGSSQPEDSRDQPWWLADPNLRERYRE